MDQKTSDPPSCCPNCASILVPWRIPSVDPTDAKMPDTLNEQDKSRAPGSNWGNDEVEEEGLWQFAMRLPKPHKESRWYAFRCLACQWICPGTHSISHIRLHFTHSQDCEVSCPKVTQNILDRLKALDETKDVPTMETLEYLSRNRKRMSESVSSTPDTSGAGPKSSSSASVNGKKARKEPSGATNSPCLGTPAKKMKPQPAASQAPIMPDADREHLDQMVQVLRRETVALKQQISTSVAPEARVFFLEKVCALHQVAVDLSIFCTKRTR